MQAGRGASATSRLAFQLVFAKRPIRQGAGERMRAGGIGCGRVSPWRFELEVDASQGAAVWPIVSGAANAMRAQARACGLHVLARALRVATTDVWSGCLAHWRR